MIHCIIFRDSWQAVSSHVPTRGTTPLQDKSPNRVRCFNPRSREGNDQSRCGSIRFSAGFNPRSHEGNDPARLDVRALDTVSIHVPTRGTTLRAVSDEMKKTVSIHVPTRGTTAWLDKTPLRVPVSIHVPTRGTTGLAPWTWSDNYVSIHVPTRGTT